MAAGCLSAQSLNATLRAADGTIGEAIEAIGDEDDGFADAERRDELQRALSRLTDRERRALQSSRRSRLLDAGDRPPDGAVALPGVAARRARAAPAAARRSTARRSPAAPREEAYVRLADADPELFAGVARGCATRRRRSARAARAGTLARPAGTSGTASGLLVLSGALLRTVTLDGKPRAELIGPGDLIRRDEPRARCRRTRPGASSSRRSSPCSTSSLCRWPSVIDALLRRAPIARTRSPCNSRSPICAGPRTAC